MVGPPPQNAKQFCTIVSNKPFKQPCLRNWVNMCSISDSTAGKQTAETANSQFSGLFGLYLASETSPLHDGG